jgi:folate-dependent phosphoribosylglycinamide formyltransferase PurN
MIWIAFFSQTGSEIAKLSRILNRIPNLIVTNRHEHIVDLSPYVKGLKTTIMYGNHDMLMKYLDNQTLYTPEDTLITLHGYLRILPPEICNKYEIYNGHPGAITMHPELKGKDPQVRAWEGSYSTVGSVVHRVTPGVDEGEVFSSVFADNTATTLDEMYGILTETSLKSWVQFMKEKLK